MSIIELPLPDDLNKAITSVTNDKVEFILEAIKEKLQDNKLGAIKSKLVEGYSQNHEENLTLVKEFESPDLSNWDDY